MKFIAFSLILIINLQVFSQEDLLKSLESTTTISKKIPISSTFKSYKLINFETTKLVPKQHLDLIIAHRFGSVKNGIDDLFGLDQASTRIQFIYGLTDAINLSFSRSKFEKTYDLAAKYKLKSQEKHGFPITIVGYNLIAVNTALDKELSVLPKLSFENRLRYANQLIISRKINPKLSLEVIPTFFYDGLVQNPNQENAQFAIGMGGKYQISKRFGVIMDYGSHLNRTKNTNFNNPFSIGMEIETGGHVFQLHFTNAQGMFENAFLANANGDWSNGDFFFGFNLHRDFNFKPKSKKP
ncbi:DUF5777 family beta-barrel protein [Aquimarina agarilytica]|uniref:DUF5777 family beta-barrel protein n=1 Tax=Aquimarina agarilytica TaxID=1087449 RepID=UPI000287A5F6|nr:DUF5777 family beta-barrel protein [Aquimarina agarilytica]